MTGAPAGSDFGAELMSPAQPEIENMRAVKRSAPVKLRLSLVPVSGLDARMNGSPFSEFDEFEFDELEDPKVRSPGSQMTSERPLKVQNTKSCAGA
jgi:hypothetical protein